MNSNSYSVKSIFLVLVAISLNISGVYYFFTGFLPQKITINKKSTWNLAYSNSLEIKSENDLLAPKYDKLVFMVVDALRNLLKNGKAIGFTANAKIPTVTLPRIKAMMTGTIPGYIDAVTNLLDSKNSTGTSDDQQDSIIWQLVNASKKNIHMYGDDTWLRLFPNSFSEYEGTTSFYVSDTVQVDLNVTRNLDKTFSNPTNSNTHNWDVLILHYLGLDHIGHLEGPNSKLMPPKQKEMDDIVKKIYSQIEKNDIERNKASNGKSKPTLLILLGDHGMNELGNHGGNSAGEVSPAMVFISPTQEKLKAYELCALQINNLLVENSKYTLQNHNSEISHLAECKNLIGDFEKLQCIYTYTRNMHKKLRTGNFNKSQQAGMSTKLVSNYNQFVKMAQSVISKQFSGYDESRIVLGSINCEHVLVADAGDKHYIRSRFSLLHIWKHVFEASIEAGCAAAVVLVLSAVQRVCVQGGFNDGDKRGGRVRVADEHGACWEQVRAEILWRFRGYVQAAAVPAADGSGPDRADQRRACGLVVRAAVCAVLFEVACWRKWQQRHRRAGCVLQAQCSALAVHRCAVFDSSRLDDADEAAQRSSVCPDVRDDDGVLPMLPPSSQHSGDNGAPGRQVPQHVLAAAGELICIAKAMHYSFGNTNSISSFDLSFIYTGLADSGSHGDVVSLGAFVYQLRVLVNAFMCNFAAPIFFAVAVLAIATASAAASFAATSTLTMGPSYNKGSRNDNDDDAAAAAAAYANSNGSTASNVFFSSRAYLLDVPLLTLALNSLLLVVLFISICFFKTHLFIWSVFAPKLLYSIASNLLNIVLFLFSLAIYSTLSLYL
ncbi:GPI ethanolamine phosphate transferase 2 [Smittium culicis]|uniref:GPI ethanolamine phosphate transferase 2 n=1 Tax=Smittium culicis TaxID=133412 RepID=A0A1R1YIX6_9FUNG|nr:GPI ethanolamine phosphate transferase 2 [Smittium culicis]